MSKTETEKILARHHIKLTAVRILVLNTLLKEKSALSLKKLEESLFFSDKSTLFRTLQLFKDKGLLHELIDETGIKNYALCSENCSVSHNHNHAHFKCDLCKTVSCIPFDVTTIMNDIENYQINEAHFFLTGTCYKCNQVA